jgi:hypothetical protein
MTKSFFAQWISQIFNRHASRSIDVLVDKIVRDCRTTLVNRVMRASGILSPEQMRGYVRAYATTCIAKSMEQNIGIESIKTKLISRVAVQAKEMLIEMVIRDVQSLPPTIVANLTAAA